jgi:hypothetical protein
MNKSEKIKTIKEIGDQLKSEEWGLIDLTLKQFGFPTSDTFNGEKFDYVIGSLENAEDENLSELASHLNISFDSLESDLQPDFWKSGYLRLFISHLATDKKTAQELKNRLEKYSISGFVAHSDIEPTKEWQNEIEIALRTCDALVALMVKGFHKSKWTDQEIGLVLGRDLLIIPVRMGEDPYGFIGKFQAISYTDIPTLAETIFNSLNKNKKTNKKLADSLMYKFENSDSFADAKYNIELIEKLEYWDKKLIRRLKNAKENNSQISHSFGVPERIKSLINRIEKKKYGT